MTQFTDLGLNAALLKALAAEGYTTPTPIQAQAIPPVMEGRDMLGIAQTGTGKTAAFALPILHRLAADRKPAPRNGCRVLVLSPTRELATQIAESFRTYGKGLNMTVATVFGGAKMGPQTRALAAGVDVLVCTPGRLIDHIGQRTAKLGETEIFVLDEADQMLDLGFLVPIRRIVSTLPKERQNLFFSATMPSEIGKLAADLLRNPAKVSITPAATTVELIAQRVIFVESERKRELLTELLEDQNMTRTLIFTKTKRGADRVAKHLVATGVNAAAIHGDKSQPQRERALAEFKAGKARVLVATDIAARGIDVDAVSHVINYELPFVPEAYVHRIGRTARAGASGQAISLCADDERNLLKDIQRTIRMTLASDDRRRDKALGLLAQARAQSEPAQPPRDRQAHGRGGQSQQRRGAPGGTPGHAKPAPFSDKPVKRRRRPGTSYGSESVAAAAPAHRGGQDQDRHGLDAMLRRSDNRRDGR